jgi:ATP-dependent Clp protease ATP-binding subunit ClpA
VSDASIFVLCTDRNRRVLGLMRDATTDLPESRDEGHPLPLREPVSVAARALEALGIATEDVVAAATTAIGGRDAAAHEGAQRAARLGRRGKSVVRLEVSAARELEDNYISTGHQLLALSSGWRSGTSRILKELGVPDRRRLREAVREADTERDRLRHQVATLAASDPELLHSVTALATGTTKPPRWMRRRVERRIAELSQDQVA